MCQHFSYVSVFAEGKVHALCLGALALDVGGMVVLAISSPLAALFNVCACSAILERSRLENRVWIWMCFKEGPLRRGKQACIDGSSFPMTSFLLVYRRKCSAGGAWSEVRVHLNGSSPENRWRSVPDQYAMQIQSSKGIKLSHPSQIAPP